MFSISWKEENVFVMKQLVKIFQHVMKCLWLVVGIKVILFEWLGISYTM